MHIPDSRGRSSRRWRQLKQEVYARRERCCRCGQPINYALPYTDPLTGQPNPDSKTVDHYPHPRSVRPDLAEDLSNLHAAHLRCNLSAGDSTTQPAGVGITSRAW